jgi:transposase
MASVEVLAVLRRPRWSGEQKRAIVAAAFGPGAVARQADVTPSLIYRWRRDLRAAANGFAQGWWRGLAMASPYRLCRRSRSNSWATPVRIPASVSPAFAAAVVEARARR